MGKIVAAADSPMSYMRVNEVAKALGLERKTIIRLIKAGKLPAVRLGRIWLVDRTALLNVLDSLGGRYNSDQ